MMTEHDPDTGKPSLIDRYKNHEFPRLTVREFAVDAGQAGRENNELQYLTAIVQTVIDGEYTFDQTVTGGLSTWGVVKDGECIGTITHSEIAPAGYRCWIKGTQIAAPGAFNEAKAAFTKGEQ